MGSASIYRYTPASIMRYPVLANLFLLRVFSLLLPYVTRIPSLIDKRLLKFLFSFWHFLMVTDVLISFIHSFVKLHFINCCVVCVVLSTSVATVWRFLNSKKLYLCNINSYSMRVCVTYFRSEFTVINRILLQLQTICSTYMLFVCQIRWCYNLLI